MGHNSFRSGGQHDRKWCATRQPIFRSALVSFHTRQLSWSYALTRSKINRPIWLHRTATGMADYEIYSRHGDYQVQLLPGAGVRRAQHGGEQAGQVYCVSRRCTASFRALEDMTRLYDYVRSNLHSLAIEIGILSTLQTCISRYTRGACPTPRLNPSTRSQCKPN